MSELVQRLSEGQHPLVLNLHPEMSIAELRRCLDRGYVHVLFTGTRGGTELGVAVDRERSDLSHADFDAGKGRLTLVGSLTLDYVKVRCIADVELPGLVGHGHLETISG
jgi:hypothetical protein